MTRSAPFCPIFPIFLGERLETRVSTHLESLIRIARPCAPAREILTLPPATKTPPGRVSSRTLRVRAAPVEIFSFRISFSPRPSEKTFVSKVFSSHPRRGWQHLLHSAPRPHLGSPPSPPSPWLFLALPGSSLFEGLTSALRASLGSFPPYPPSLG